jgi:Repeat of unknown function (DUF5648)
MRIIRPMLAALGLLVSTIASGTPLVPPASPLVTVVEYYNTALGHYFMTGEAAEAAFLDGGGLGPTWVRTGYVFSAWHDPAPGRVAVCRFFGHQPGGPNSHFYTANAAECASVKLNPAWMFEGIAFYTVPFSPATGCPAGTYRVYRAYNNGMGGDPNHRYTNRVPVFNQMAAAGWYPEGEVMCTPTPPVTIDEMIAACPTAADIDYINARLTINFLVDVSAPTLVCTQAAGSHNLTRVQERLYQALKAMFFIRFTSPPPWTSQLTLFDWMINESGVKGINVDASGSSYCCDTGPNIHLNMASNSVVLATNRWVDLYDGFGLADLVDLISHESRHDQGKVHTCTTVSGNDETLGELGAWAIVYYDYIWFAGAADPSFIDHPPAGTTNSVYPSYHAYYLARAASTLSSRICNPAL